MIYSSFLKLLNYCVTIIFNHFSRNNVKRIGVNEEGVPKFLLSPMKILKIIISRVSEARIHLSTIVHPADRNQRTRLCTAVTSFDNTGSGRNFKAHLCLGHHRRLASPGIQGKTSEALEIEQLYFTNFLPFQRVSLKINLKRVIADVRSFVIIENICTRGMQKDRIEIYPQSVKRVNIERIEFKKFERQNRNMCSNIYNKVRSENKYYSSSRILKIGRANLGIFFPPRSFSSN